MSNFIGSSRQINTNPRTPSQLRTTLYKLLQSLNEDASSLGSLDDVQSTLLAAREQTSIADEQIELGEVVRIASTNHVEKAQADALANADVAGVATMSAASGDPITWAPRGVIHKDSWGLTPGVIYYLSAATAGLLTATAPTTAGQVVIPVGQALTADDFLVSLGTSVLL